MTFRVREELALSVAIFAAFLVTAQPVFALSELKNMPDQATGESAQSAPQVTEPNTVEGDSDGGIPMPSPLIDKSAGTNDQTAGEPDEDQPVVSDIQHDNTKAPAAVQRLRQLIVEASATGDIEKLRPLVNPGPNQAQITGDDGDDPIAALKSFSGDPDGLEVLAILLDLLSTGYAHMDAGTPEEMYVWPYFVGKSLNELTAPEKVELLRIITAGDLADMQEYGTYSFYRIGITPDGQWKFFTAGD
ncbi:hypothetical protein M2418_001233 [Rhizobium sp. BIGb0125]|uniref:hypothetical protein n=2 Tax=unclassified Rhizobium TaxID=2613769 RepID=UPI0021690A28|nr:hypothetical protein [Rhizobium sp. BIGb0125]MCS4241722.1 hypothetical protein [Rhizobium sp. BIGb0125]